MKGIIKKLAGYSGLGLVAVLSSQAHASGYRMEFQSPSVLADAGEAAVIEDAGTNWYNSAGLVYLPQQLAASLIDVYAPTSFSGNVNAPSSINAIAPALASNFSASGSASSHPNSALPAFHYALPLSDRYAVGISMAPAWGFAEDYGEHSLVRYSITKVYTKTIEISPSFAMKINDQWSFGLGPDFHYFSVQSRFHVRTQGNGLVPGVGTPNDSISRYSADNWGFGGHGGLLFRLNDRTRIGLNYRTKMVMDLSGYSDFALNQIASYETGNFKVGIPLPPTTTVSVYHDVTPTWALMGTLAYDQWNVLKNYHAKNFIQPPTSTNPSGIIPDVVLPQYMGNTVDASIGTHYKWNEKLMLRGSLKYQTTPTQNQYRALNFPDGIKLGVNVGARYQYNAKLAFDFIYAHVFVRTMPINDINPVTGSTAIGQSRTSIDLAGGQIVWNI